MIFFKQKIVIKNLITIISSFPLLLAAPLKAECIIKMAYKEGEKLPFIKKAPDNTGAYRSLFQKAAEKLDCSLEITRLPKKRLHKQLATGQLDFYPGASFSTNRAKYLYFLENGFKTGEFGLTRAGTQNLQGYRDVKKANMIWLMELGGSKEIIAHSLQIKSIVTPTVSVEKVKKMLLLNRVDFYVSDKEPLDYYLKQKNIESYASIGLQIHPNCCGGLQPMYMGFSRLSPHFQEVTNPSFDKNKKISTTNTTTTISPNCIAAKLSKTLLELSNSGETQKIYDKFFTKRTTQE